ncbi:DUF4861 family protein [Opitutus sp. ER46]|uniref:DUF4861 family protein n=1 Tax=Opitutus sp. ER46 TaxID=2161864 RepID=UPI000D30D5F6|nr:DUF4861 family protein [Opitutus sp. ER46]PTX92724.1 DUF4861 domain-containing protein [Opitutus sp. ER46]
MKLRHLALLPLLPLAALAADKFTVTVTHSLDIARPSEMIAVPWTEVNKAMPGALLQKITVRDASGRALPYQVTNVAPLAKDPKGEGLAYGELLFQHDFAAGEKSATFTVERSNDVTQPFPVKAFARYVPERLDDFAWENDRLGHRTYGPALAAPDPTKKKEVLVTSGLDIWCKRVEYPIVDRWYNKGHDHYHKDEGEGMDMYQVGTTRGCGGTGVWDGSKLFVGQNYTSWKVIANGPIRAVFELTYAPWDANGVKVSEVKRFIVDAGHNLDVIESTFTFEGAPELTVAVGLNKNSGDKGQAGQSEITTKQPEGWLAQWELQKSNGELGTAIIIPGAEMQGFADDNVNRLVLAKAKSGQPVRYLVGAGWTRAGHFTSRAAWEAYVAAEAARARSPIKVTVAAQ